MQTKAQIHVLSEHTGTVTDLKCQDSVIMGSMDTKTNCQTVLNLDCRSRTRWQTHGQDPWCGSDLSLLGSNIMLLLLLTSINPPWIFAFSSANSCLVMQDALA